MGVCVAHWRTLGVWELAVWSKGELEVCGGVMKPCGNTQDEVTWA